MLTKPLPYSKFIYFRDMVMGGEKLQKHFEDKTIATHVVVAISGAEDLLGTRSSSLAHRPPPRS
jgi:hypothetical protein